MCERDGEKSENLKPRYNATFIHKKEDIVIELIPLEAERVIKEINQERTIDGHQIGFEMTDNVDSPRPGYEWEISFADENIMQTIENQYDNKIVPIEAYNMMLDINEQLG
jgi:hypothetical protein